MARNKLTLFILALAVFTFGLDQVIAVDLWWQMANARWVIQHCSFLRVNPFLYSMPSAPYIDHEWLSGVIFYWVYGAWGEMGIVFLRAAIFTLIAAVWFAAITKKRPGSGFAVLLVMVGLLFLKLRFPARPEMWSCLFLSLLAALPGEGPLTRRAAIIGAIFMLWANLHGGFVLGWAYLAGVWILSVKEDLTGRRSILNRDGACLLTAIGATMMNPYGIKLWGIPWRFVTDPSLIGITHEGRTQFSLLAPVSILIIVIILVLAFERRVRTEGQDEFWVWKKLAPSLVLGLMTLKMNRLTPMFLCAAYPILASWLAVRAGNMKARSRALMRAVLGAGVIAVMALTVRPLAALREPFLAEYYPKKACDFMSRTGVSGRVLAAFHYGGYLSWRLFPQARIFYNSEYFSTPLAWRFQAALRTPSTWKEFLRDTQADYVLADWVWMGLKQPLLGSAWPIDRHSPYVQLYPREKWALIYWDDHSLLLARRPTSFKEFSWTEPLDFDATLERVKRGELTIGMVQRELERAKRLTGPHQLLNHMESRLSVSHAMINHTESHEGP